VKPVGPTATPTIAGCPALIPTFYGFTPALAIMLAPYHKG
jgi:hypothetical protein